MAQPEILWAQSRDKIFITLTADGINQYDIEINENNITLKDMSLKDMTLKDMSLKDMTLKDMSFFELNFLKNINKEESYFNSFSNKLEFCIIKEFSVFWKKLSNDKYNFRVNWNKWVDEDSDDDDQTKTDMVNNFTDFTKTLPSELMEKDFSTLMEDDFSNLFEEKDTTLSIDTLEDNSDIEDNSIEDNSIEDSNIEDSNIEDSNIEDSNIEDSNIEDKIKLSIETLNLNDDLSIETENDD